jgi:hypothetical protein
MLVIVPAKNELLIMWLEEQAEITYTARHVWVLAASKSHTTDLLAESRTIDLNRNVESAYL